MLQNLVRHTATSAKLTTIARDASGPDARIKVRKFANRVDTSKRGEPAALAIVVGTGYGYVRPDGVHVIPIGTLAP